MSEAVERFSSDDALFARHDPLIVLSDLFKIRNKSDVEQYRAEFRDKAGNLSVQRKTKRAGGTFSYVADEDSILTFTCWELCNEIDLRVLAACGAIASAGIGEEIPLDEKNRTKEQEVAWQHLGQTNLAMSAAQKKVPFAIKTTISEIAKQIGYSLNGKTHVHIQQSLARLARVSVEWRWRGKMALFNLLHFALADDGEAAITFNALTAQAFAGGRKPHIRIDMSDIRTLEATTAERPRGASAAAIILYQRLCAQIRPGESKKFLANTLTSYIWPAEEAHGSMTDKELRRLRDQRSNRKKSLSKALSDLAILGWTSAECFSAKSDPAFAICRPKPKAWIPDDRHEKGMEAINEV